MAEDLTEKFAYEIVAMLKSGEISVKEVIEASRKRHEEVDRYVNALPLTFYDKALKRADEIDLKKKEKIKKVYLGYP